MRLTCLYFFFAFISGVRSEGSSRIIRPLSHCECGLIKNDFLRIVGGVDADINEFPWIVGLYTHQGCRGQPVCGGTLISSQHVLTAAHCIQRVWNLYLLIIVLKNSFSSGNSQMRKFGRSRCLHNF